MCVFTCCSISLDVFVHVFPPCHLMSHVGRWRASGDYLSPWELDDRRGGLMTASCGEVPAQHERVRERVSGQRGREKNDTEGV